MNKVAYIGINPKLEGNRKYFARLTHLAYTTLGIETNWIACNTNWEHYWAPEYDFETPEYYILADDDCIPGTVDMFEKAYKLLEMSPKVGMVGFNLSKIPEAYRVHMAGWYIVPNFDFDLPMAQVKEICGIRVVRSNIVKEADAVIHEGREDKSFCDAIMKKGYEIVAMDIPFHHLGEGFSLRT